MIVCFLWQKNMVFKIGSFLNSVGGFAVQNHRIAALALDSPDLRITIKAILGLGYTHQVQRNQLTLKA